MKRISIIFLAAALALASGCVYVDAEPAQDGSGGGAGSTANSPPDVRLEARGGPFVPGDDVTIDASATTDADEDELSYEWMVFGPRGDQWVFGQSVSGRAIEFRAFDAGQYVVSVTVDDGVNTPVNEAMTIRVENRLPNISVSTCSQPTDLIRYQRSGDWLEIEVGVPQTLCLDASPSTDPEGHALSYQWTVFRRPASTSEDVYDGSVLRLNMPESGYYEGFLEATDEHGATATMDFSVVVR